MSDRPHPPLPVVVLAGERVSPSPLATAFSVAAGVLVPVAGRPSIARVFTALRASRMVQGGRLCGPDRPVISGSPALQALLAPGDFTWVAPQAGPAASVVASLEALGRFPTLVTTGDHALLRPETIDDFCRQALRRDEDVLVGLVPYETVMDAFPETHRTALRFAGNECWCGSNLFLFRTAEGLRAANFWRQVESMRKKPWKIARHLGLTMLARYLTHRLTLDQALADISRRSGCRVGYVVLSDPRAAVDVDSVADQALAERLLESDPA